MSNTTASRQLLASASVVAMAMGFLAAPTAPAVADSYMAGDFHNHTTCTDGTVSIETMMTHALSNFHLDWLASADHGGTGQRDCRFSDKAPDGTATAQSWEQTLGQNINGITVTSIKGDVASGSPRPMWRWQMIEEVVFPEVARVGRNLSNPMVYAGLETNVPGHEHTSTTVLGQQRNYLQDPNNIGNASDLAEFEYRFDRSDTDMSAGAGHNWTGKVANASGTNSGTLNHQNKAVPSVAWMQQHFPLDSYYVPAHVERAGIFNPNGNNGFNVEHFRDFNNAGPTVAVGFETMPGHQASSTRGEYRANFCGTGCDSVGVNTYGGTGIYGAKIGGLWDAMLGEGRNWFFFASSDWHNRGQFSPYEPYSTADFYPGEYQKLYVPRPAAGVALRPQLVIDGVRSGNSFSVTGDLITGELTYTAEVVGMNGPKAKMGETLVVPRGRTVRITLEVTQSTGNNSPYSFNNPSLAQIGILEPLNKPTLRHVQFIKGNVTGVISPNSPDYKNATNPSAGIVARFGTGAANNWTVNGQKRTMTFTIPNIQNSQYVRARGSNLPPAVNFETDGEGSPLQDLDATSDAVSAFVPCTDAACPSYLPTKNGIKVISYDVGAWSEAWFYTNPIFIRVQGTPELLVETNAKLAQTIKAQLGK